MLHYCIIGFFDRRRARQELGKGIAVSRLVYYSKWVLVRSASTTIMVLKEVTVVEC